jgi:MIP family channel proteins
MDPQAVNDRLRPLLGECLGTFLLVGIGTGTVASSVLLGRPETLAAVALLWGLGVVVAITASARLSGAHLNPAVSLAFALWRPASFPRRRLLPYCAAQLAGAALAGAAVLALFGPSLRSFEAREGLVRGEPGSERAAMVFGEYFPNPAKYGPRHEARIQVSPVEALLFEAAGTMLLVLVVFAVSGPRSPRVRRLGPWLVGAAVSTIIWFLAPTTQSCLNPARDLGPRLVAFAAGYGSVALPGPDGGFWVYIVGPLLGGTLGGLFWACAHCRPGNPRNPA